MFNSGQELAAHLQVNFFCIVHTQSNILYFFNQIFFKKLLSSLNEKESQLESFRNNLKDFSSWSDEWENKIKPELSLF